MLTSEIITDFEMYVDDGTELSTSESLRLANKYYRKVLNNRPWSFLKKAYSGVTTSNGYIDLPADFKYVISNDSYTDNTTEYEGRAAPKVVFIGSTYQPYQIVNWSDRARYRNYNNIAYIDATNNRMYFTGTQSAGQAVEFDYIYRPDDLTLNTRPVWDEDFDYIIMHGMAADDYMIQQFDKARSYRDENLSEYTRYLRDMQWQDAQLTMN